MLFLLLFVCIPFVFCADDQQDLISVIVIFRHGDRTPVNPYPNDPYGNHSYWPVGWGQLTNKGKMQHYELGRWFRERYQTFLPQTYSEKDIYVRSTDVDRTLMSAEANLAGLYPPNGTQVWDNKLKWQPIPIHTKPEKEDAVLAAKKTCPQYDYEVGALLSSAQFKKINEQNKELYEYVTKYSGKLVNSLESLEYIYNTLVIEQQNGFKLPAWTDPIFPDKMKPLAALSFAVSCYTPQLARLKIGQLLNEIINHMHNITTPDIKHKYRRRFWMYSAHDTTIANVLNGLELFEYHSPPYAATILFELRVNPSDEFFVKLFYKNGTEPRPLKLRDCDWSCPLDDFIGILSPLVITAPEWEEECELRLFSVIPVGYAENAVVGIVAIVVVALLLTAMIGLFVAKKRPQQQYLRLPDEDA